MKAHILLISSPVDQIISASLYQSSLSQRQMNDRPEVDTVPALQTEPLSHTGYVANIVPHYIFDLSIKKVHLQKTGGKVPGKTNMVTKKDIIYLQKLQKLTIMIMNIQDLALKKILHGNEGILRAESTPWQNLVYGIKQLTIKMISSIYLPKQKKK